MSYKQCTPCTPCKPSKLYKSHKSCTPCSPCKPSKCHQSYDKPYKYEWSSKCDQSYDKSYNYKPVKQTKSAKIDIILQDPLPAEKYGNPCTMCLTNTSDIVFNPCSHIVMCSHCANSWKTTQQDSFKCPKCMISINATITLKKFNFNNIETTKTTETNETTKTNENDIEIVIDI